MTMTSGNYLISTKNSEMISLLDSMHQVKLLVCLRKNEASLQVCCTHVGYGKREFVNQDQLLPTWK